MLPKYCRLIENGDFFALLQIAISRYAGKLAMFRQCFLVTLWQHLNNIACPLGSLEETCK